MQRRPRFDLIVEPWIPCETSTGARVELGLADVFRQAHELRAIHDDSPLVTAALHRLLLAILHRCFGPATIREWRTLWGQARFDTEVIRKYLDAWRHRFDLFDEERPFYQTPGMTYEPKRATSIVTERSQYGAPVFLFGHQPESLPEELSPNHAARLVVSLQNFALGGLMTRGSGEPPSATHAPLPPGVMILVSGAHLFQTLLLNLLTGETVRSRIDNKGNDKPAWEQDEPARIGRRIPFGWMDLLTWQSRRIMLVPKIRENKIVVTHVTVAGGVDLERENLRDPMQAWRLVEKRGWFPVAFNTDRAVWRDSTALLRLGKTETEPPLACRQLETLIRNSVLPREQMYSLDLFGLSSDQAKVLLFRHERMPLPLALLADDLLAEMLEIALKLASDVENKLLVSIRQVAENALSPGFDPQTKTGRPPLPADVTKIVKATHVSGVYWSRLREPFEAYLRELAHDADAAQAHWERALRRVAIDCFQQASDALGRTARVFKGSARGNRFLYIELKKLGLGAANIEGETTAP